MTFLCLDSPWMSVSTVRRAGDGTQGLSGTGYGYGYGPVRPEPQVAAWIPWWSP